MSKGEVNNNNNNKSRLNRGQWVCDVEEESEGREKCLLFIYKH